MYFNGLAYPNKQRPVIIGLEVQILSGAAEITQSVVWILNTPLY